MMVKPIRARRTAGAARPDKAAPRPAKATRAKTVRAPVILLTGVPGTGKTTLAALLAKKTGARVLDLNAIAARAHLYLGRRHKDGAREVDLRKLEATVNTLISLSDVPLVIEGHLGCEMRLDAARVLVLRLDPKALQKRLHARSYATSKVEDNLMCEMLDYCLVRAQQNYPARAILQLDLTGLSKSEAVQKILKARKSDKVDWSGRLLG